MEVNKIYQGDCFELAKQLDDESINCIITSPPYWCLRDYQIEGQIGLEPTFQEYINKLCDLFDILKHKLRKDGTCWVNLGDTYSGSGNGSCDYRTEACKNFMNRQQYEEKYNNQKSGKTCLSDKSLCNIPARFSIEMQNKGWILRNVII